MTRRNRPFLTLALAAFGNAIVCAWVVAGFVPTSHAATGDADASFAKTAAPFVNKYCVECHGQTKPKGGVRLHGLSAANVANADAETWGKVLEALEFGDMPPSKAPQPTKAEVAQVTAWVKAQLAAAGRESDVDHKLSHPAFANRISHEKLFDGSQKGPAFSRPRLWRIHPEAYANFLDSLGRELGKGGPLSHPFTVSDGKGLASNYAPLYQADSATLSQLMLNCRQIAQMQTIGFKRMEKDRKTQKEVERVYRRSPDSFTAILEGEGDPTDDQLRAAVTDEFQLFLSRAPSDEELTSYVDLLKRASAIGGKARGLRTMAMAVLLRPESIYRMEVGLTTPDEHGRRMLSPYELAHAIAYALTDTPPAQLYIGPPKERDRSKRPQPPSLIDLAESGKLSTRDDVRRVVLQILENDAIDKPRILRFFREFFGYHGVETVFKGERGSRAFHTRHIIKHADTLVLHIVKNDRDVLKELLTTEKFFFEWPGSVQEYDRRVEYITKRLNGKNPKETNFAYFITRTKETGKRPIPQANPTWRQTALFYNIDPKTWDFPVEQPFAMPKGQRSGILTHPAWLGAWSGNFDNDPIRRGKWIREHLLADSVPEVPITVDASVPHDPDKTLRQRLTKTREEYCWQCHSKMDPLGLPFEAYTDFGRYRTQEGLGDTKALQKPKRTAPVVTTGQIINSGDPSIDGDVENVHDLMHRLAGSSRVRQSFVRHAFRYWLGRNEMLSDSPTLIAADKAYVDGGGSFKALVVELLTSDSFLYRR